MLLVILADIFRAETLRQVEIHLDRSALPIAPEGILQREFELRTVKRAFARIQHIIQPGELCRFGESRFGLVPDFIASHALCRTGRELHLHIVESEIVIDFLYQVTEVRDFARDLVFGTEDVRIVLHKSANTHQPVHCSRRLVAVALAELGEAHRKVAPAPQLGIENQNVARAVHRLHGHFHVAGERLEHVLVVLVRMAGLYPQHLVHDFRRDNFQVAPMVDFPADVILERVHHLRSLRMPEHHAGRMVLDVVEVHFLADFPVVALGGFFQKFYVCREAVLVRKAGAIDARQLVGLLVSVPVGARKRENLEALELSRAGNMRPRAEIFPILSRFACRIETDFAVLAFAFNRALGVVVLVLVAFGTPKAFFGRNLDTGKRTVFLDDFLHPLFDFREVLFLERCRRHQIVIETLFDRRAVSELCPREQVANRFRKNMAAGMAQKHERIGIVIRRRDYPDVPALGKRTGKVQNLVAELYA